MTSFLDDTHQEEGIAFALPWQISAFFHQVMQSTEFVLNSFFHLRQQSYFRMTNFRMTTNVGLNITSNKIFNIGHFIAKMSNNFLLYLVIL